MNGAAARLRVALKRCVVRLSGNGRRGGSGFFVAPGYVLTCAHVVAGASSVMVTWQDDSNERVVSRAGVVRFCQPDCGASAESIFGYPDLAVVQLAAPPDQPCVGLWSGDVTPDEDLPLHAPLYAYGYNTVYSGKVPEGAGIALTAGGSQRFGDGTFVRVMGDELPPGVSGGPIMDLTTGRVVAIVKTTRKIDAPYGGLAVPLSALDRVPHELRSAIRDGHDSYHASGGRAWPGLVDQLRVDRLRVERREPPAGADLIHLNHPPSELSALDEAELMGLLADLPPTDNLFAFFRVAAPYFPAPGWNWGLLDRRDVVHLLNDGMAAFGRELPALVVFIELVAHELSGQPAAELRAWNERFTRIHGWYAQLMEWRSTSQRPAPGEPKSVIAHVTPSGNPSQNDSNDRFNLRILLYHERGCFQAFDDEQGPFTLDELCQHLRNNLPDALNELHSRPSPVIESPLIELILPLELFDTAVDRWPFSPRRRNTRLGRIYPVVIRALDDEDYPEVVQRKIEERWAALSDRPIDSHLHWLPCEEELDQDELDKWLWRSVDNAALGLPGPAGETKHRDALDAALFAGLPVAIFRRIPCDQHGETGDPDFVDNGGEEDEECSGYQFSQVLTARLDGVTVDQLPYTIRELRADDDRSLHDVVLLWQNPARRLPTDPWISP